MNSIINQSKYYPYYDTIINYDNNNQDKFTHSLINWYQTLISQVDNYSSKQLIVISTIDESIYLYLHNPHFHNQFRYYINIQDINITNPKKLKTILRKIITITYLYKQKEVSTHTCF